MTIEIKQTMGYQATDGSFHTDQYQARKVSVKHELQKLLDQKKDRSLVDWLYGNSTAFIDILSQAGK